MKFQCISWYANDISVEADNFSEGFDDADTERLYTICIFGRTLEGKSVTLKTHFEPYFFVEIPQVWRNTDVTNKLINEMKKVMGKQRDDFLSYAIVSRKKFYGFTNDEYFKFVRIQFKTHGGFKRAVSVLSRPNKYISSVDKSKCKLYDYEKNKPRFQIYEANIDPMLRFCHVQHIKTAGWIHIEDKNYMDCDKSTYSDIEILASSWRHIKSDVEEGIAPIIQASFDIETYSYDGSFPDAKDKGCPCIQVATTFQRYGEPEPYKRSLISYGTCDPIKNCEVIECETEKELLEKWTKLIRTEDVDVLIGYNIWGFDLNYMWIRAKMTKAYEFFELGRLIGKQSDNKESAFSSGAYGDSDFHMVDSIGRFQLDLLVIMKREHKLTSYSLNSVSEHFLKDKKVDMPYKLMFQKYKGSSKDRQEIGEYCVKDTDLPLALVNKLAIMPNTVEMAKATWVPMSFLIERGQGIKVFSQILYQTRQEDMLVITLNRDGETEQTPYEGATVLQAMKGAYIDDPITGLDFASLYPTIMRAHNLCHSTLVMDNKYDNLENIEYYESEGFRFAQNNEGILPKMLRILASNRKQAKKDMADAEKRGDDFMKSVYNGKQLAFKVSMNSIYGFTGALVGFLPCKPVASCTTSIGRGMIEHTKNLVEKWYPGAEVVYGDTDSVMVKFYNDGLKGKDALPRSFELGIEAADRISKTFKHPIELEFEKVYLPYLLFSKKRYAGLMYTKPEKPDYIDAKGIQLVRRDNCPYVKQISTRVLNTIMYELDTNKAVDMVKEAASYLLDRKVPIRDLVVSKSLKRLSYLSDKEIDELKSKSERKLTSNDKKILQKIDKKQLKLCNGFYLSHEYANPNLPHITVAIKREERLAGSGPKSGDRVPYVFIDTGNKNDLQYTKAEDPEYAEENDLKIDVLYYLEHGLRSPLESLFELFLDDPNHTLFAEARQQFSSQSNRQANIYDIIGLSMQNFST